jgi:Tfp pilus assembly protein PilN
MIRINLLASERAQVKKKVTFHTGQKLTVGCSLILVAAVLLVGWRYWSLTRQSAQLDRDIVAAQQEVTRLHSVIQKVQDFEQRKAQLSQRVVLIEDLRKEQKGPVHILDEISKALPPMLWLTEVKQVWRWSSTGTRRRRPACGLCDQSRSLRILQEVGRHCRDEGASISQAPGELVAFTSGRSS